MIGFWIRLLLSAAGTAAFGVVAFKMAADLIGVLRGERLTARVTDLIPETPDIYTMIPYRLKVELTRGGQTQRVLTQSGFDLTFLKKQRYETLQRKWIDRDVVVFFSEKRPRQLRRDAQDRPTVYVARLMWKEIVWLVVMVNAMILCAMWMISLFL